MYTIPKQDAEMSNLNPQIKINFDLPILYDSIIDNLHIIGSKSGEHSFSFLFENEMQNLIIELSSDLLPQENVTVTVAKQVSSKYGKQMEKDYILNFSTSFLFNSSLSFFFYSILSYITPNPTISTMPRIILFPRWWTIPSSYFTIIS